MAPPVEKSVIIFLWKYNFMASAVNAFKLPLVRESIAYPYRDFQISNLIHMDIRDFWICQSSNIHAFIDIHLDTH